MNVFYSDGKTDLKLQCDCCIKFQLFKGSQDVVTRLMAICCTAPIEYPSTTIGMSVGHPVTVNIDFCGYLRFLSCSFVSVTRIWVHYATDNLSGQQLEFIS